MQMQTQREMDFPQRQGRLPCWTSKLKRRVGRNGREDDLESREVGA